MKSVISVRHRTEDYPVSSELKKTVAAAPRTVAISFLLIVIAIIVTLFTESIFDIGFISSAAYAADDYKVSVNTGAEYLPSYNVTLTIGDTSSIINTTAQTVEDFLVLRGITADSDDYLSCSVDEELYDGMIVCYDRIDVRNVVVDEVVKYEVINNKLQTIPKGTVESVQTGSDGEVARHIKRVYTNGVLTEETEIQTDVIVEMIPEINNVGIGGKIKGNDGKTYSYSYYVDCIATAYAGPEWNPHTATGVEVKVGVIAVDPTVIPLKSVCYVCNEDRTIDLGVVYAEDTGGKIKENIIDVYMGPLEEDVLRAKQWGRKSVRVYVLE